MHYCALYCHDFLNVYFKQTKPNGELLCFFLLIRLNTYKYKQIHEFLHTHESNISDVDIKFETRRFLCGKQSILFRKRDAYIRCTFNYGVVTGRTT